MRDSVELTAGPIVKCEYPELLSLVDVSGAGDWKIIPFNRHIFWIRSSRASVKMVRNGKLLQDLREYNDYYGYLKSVESALKEAREICDSEQINAASEVQVVVCVTIVEEPAILDMSTQALEYSRSFPNKVAFNLFGQNQKMGEKVARLGGELQAWHNSRRPDERFGLYDQVPWIASKTVYQNDTFWTSESLSPDPESVFSKLAAFVEEQREAAVNHLDVLLDQRNEYMASRAKEL